MANNKNILTNDNNRLIYLEPNCSDRTIPNNEDFSILVNLKTIRKSRTTLINGQISSTKGSSRNIGFIDGTNIGGDRRSLTTNYTEIGTDFTQGGENDLETLGIESIDITFDTAYTPMIKIKFIDIRGNAVLAKGNDSKYKMFFDLPFPIFDLTVKGFYGKAVTYCLHLTKWNASFNSSTGNFEIDTEFIGYTYALLTDCLLGYMRATSLTKIGGRIFNRYRNMLNTDGTKKYPSLIAIDEFLDYVNKIDAEFSKIKNNSEDVKQINALETLIDEIDDVESYVNDTKASQISKGTNDIFKDEQVDLVLLEETHYKDKEKENIDAVIKSYKKTTDRLVKSINKKVELEGLQLDATELNKIYAYKYSTTFLITYKKLVANKVFGPLPLGDQKQKLEKIVSDAITDENKGYFLFDFTHVYAELDRVAKLIKTRKKLLDDNITDIVKNKVNNLSFKPTIRNIVNMLAVHAQVFLETIREVSKEAEKSSERKTAILKIDEFKDKNNKNTPIFPWPEYRKEENSTLVETWIGSALKEGNDYRKVNEVVFVEELLVNLMKIARNDETRELFGSSENPDFFPLTPAEVKIKTEEGDGIAVSNNPYYEALKSERSLGQPQEAIRCLLTRIFISQGVANNTTGSGNQANSVVDLIGKLEAENLYNILISEFEGINRKNFINAINGIGLTPKDATDNTIGTWSKGGDIEGIKHPPSIGLGNIVDSDGKLIINSSNEDRYYYRYINNIYTNLRNSNAKQSTTFIPISGGFDGADFYNSDGNSTNPKYTFKNDDQLKELGKELIFSSNNYRKEKFNYGVPYIDRGEFYLKILVDDEDEDLFMLPSIAKSTELDKYRKNLKNVIETGENLLYAAYQQTSLVRGDGQKDLLNRYGVLYNVLEINNIKYEDSDEIFPGKEASVITAYFEEPVEKIKGVGFYLASNTPDKNSVAMTKANLQDSDSLYQQTFMSNAIWTTETMQYQANVPNNLHNVNKAGTGGKDKFGKLSNKPFEWGKQQKLINQLITADTESANFYVPYIDFTVIGRGNKMDFSLSLFGSLFYYEQSFNKIDGDVSKAFLFLNAISWSGVIGNPRMNDDSDNTLGDDVSLFATLDLDGKNFQNEDERYILKALYNNSGSIIEAPRLWCAYIGSLLYRFDYYYGYEGGIPNGKNKELLKWNSTIAGNTDQALLPHQTKDTYFPKHDEYLAKAENRRYDTGICLDTNQKDNDDNEAYAKVDEIILGLPAPARKEFIRIFKSFVKNDFVEVQREYELFNNTDDMIIKWSSLKDSVSYYSPQGKFTDLRYSTNDKVDYQVMIWKYSTDLFWPAKGESIAAKFILKEKLKTTLSANGTDANGLPKSIRDKFKNTGEVILLNYANVSPLNNNEFQLKSYNFQTSDDVTIEGNKNQFYQFDLTLQDNAINKDKLVKLFARTHKIINATPKIFTHTSEKQDISVDKNKFKRILQQFFIRFQELTKDPEKDEDDKIQQRIFNNVDDDIIKLNIYRTISSINDKWLGGETKSIACTNIEKIAESFRFLDSGFLDIGDDFLINPLSVQQKIIGNYNQSFFDLVNSILIENNFNFIALPTYIDFTTAQNMKEAIFTPYPWSEEVSKDTAGAQFICVYTGQKSSNLNLGNDSEHEDDGFNVISDGKCDDTTNTIAQPVGQPKLFQNDTNKKGYKIPYFLVSYGKGNQSIFKDIKLDQREFTETAESLEIINDLSDTGDVTKTSYKGQNLFNTYQKRAYSAEVEMMGCATIQPMMYFQLNNIPMFKGAYLIYKTTHSITAHNMKTTFKGSRIKKVKTPLITEVQLFQSLIGSLKDGGEAKTINNKKITLKRPLTPPDTTKSNVIKISR